MAAPKMKVRIGDLLVQNGVITEDQLMAALARQKKTRQKLGKALVVLGYVTEEQFLSFLAQQLKIPMVDLSRYNFNHNDVINLSETHARRFRCVVLKEEAEFFLIGMTDPLDISAYDEIQRVLPKPIELAVVPDSQLLGILDQMYRRTSEIDDWADQLSEEIVEDTFDSTRLSETDDADIPVVRLLKSIFEDAVSVGASDIHIEPDEKVLRIRQRVDGLLQEHVMKDARIAPALILRLKLMAELNISEKRLPQDGRFNITVKGHNIDVRMSTMPIQHGESVVMRLLDQTDGLIDLDSIGLPDKMRLRLDKLIKEPHGLLLVTGPTGSGKTTTLYGALNQLNVPEKKILTVEDPVEYRLPRINQIQVHPKIGLTFATVLRSCLRQDPDILLVGEIRDLETAEIALRASITGHFVLSSLHTNDAIASAMRLIDLGIEGYLVATALRAVLAQRLVRKICKHCKADYHPSSQELAWLKVKCANTSINIDQLKQGAGCTSCHNTGYMGRVGIFELLEMDEAMADALRANDSNAFAQKARASSSYQPLVLSALEKAGQGITSLEEVFRVTEQLEDFSEYDAPAVSGGA
ncbi:MAG: Flp pilus assembly complex ATPase component TadA [Oceanospirillaceae bacterium]|nr:Flp pilus assembly complex ATPase component TadA [Oceanospirillaceae bacterium]